MLADRPKPYKFTCVELKADLISLLEDLDADEENGDYMPPSDFRALDAQVSNIQIDLHWDLLKHIRGFSEREV